MKIAVIITTYNRPSALAAVLLALQNQSLKNFEVLVADDGSTSETASLIHTLQAQLSYKLQHIWQKDEGFQAAKIRNKAVAATNSDYLIFIDGDCIPQPNFINKHMSLAESAWLVAGNRILLNSRFTNQVLTTQQNIYNKSLWYWLANRISGNCNRILPLLSLSNGKWRKLKSKKWRGIKTCNLGLWRKDFITVNGFDENYSGWGYEDSDLVIRLIRSGIRCKSGKFATAVLHLWHKEHDRSNTDTNYQRLMAIENSSNILATTGINQYL